MTRLTWDLRSHFELRKTVPTKPRVCVARWFVHKDVPGLVDASGIVWPILLAEGVPPPQSGEAVCAVLRALRSDGAVASKYDDSGFWLQVESLEERIPCHADWPSGVIPSPIPVAGDFLPDLLPEESLFFKSPPAKRAHWIDVRNKALERTRRFFVNRGFRLMETPTLVPSGGVEPYLTTFETSYTDWRGVKWPLSLPTSPEFALKKLVSEGFSKVFQVSHAYRNSGELAKWHEPEFLMLEWYRTGAVLSDIMEDTKKLVQELALMSPNAPKLPAEWPVFTVNSLFKRLCNLDLNTLQDEVDFRRIGMQQSRSVVESDDWDSVFCKLFMEFIDPFIAQHKACFVTKYPRRMGALARVSSEELYVERFEAYLFGVEICNGYHELSDTEELDRRFGVITDARGNDVRRDPVFEDTMRFGLPPCSGNAVGIDRVIALLWNVPKISDLYAVPFLSQFAKKTVANE